MLNTQKMMTFSRLTFYRHKLKQCFQPGSFSSQITARLNVLNRAVQNISGLCTKYASEGDEKIPSKSVGEPTVTEKSNEFNDIKKLSEDIRATKKKHKKAIAEMEAHMRRKYRGKYQNEGAQHVPVLQNEVLECFQNLKNKTILDMTFGSGGHSKALLEAIPGCHILALDRDPSAYKLAQELADNMPGSVTPLLGCFSDVPRLLFSKGVKLNSIGGVLMDLGVSSMQFDQSSRGFSLNLNGPLDMRMDQNRMESGPTAADVVNSLDESDLTVIFKKYGEEKKAALIAHGIVEARSAYGRILTTHQLADIVEAVYKSEYNKDKLGRASHPATKTFQALRIFVNNELNELDMSLRVAHKFLEKGGLCIAITFHSLEEKLVKQHFYNIQIRESHEKYFKNRQFSRTQNAAIVYSAEEMSKLTERNWKPHDNGAFTPKQDELQRNPRSRSAIMYAAERLV